MLLRLANYQQSNFLQGAANYTLFGQELGGLRLTKCLDPSVNQGTIVTQVTCEGKQLFRLKFNFASAVGLRKYFK